MFKVDEDLDYLTKILGTQFFDQKCADFLTKEVVQGLLESVVDDIWMLEVVVCEEVELIEEVSDVDARERIHL